MITYKCNDCGFIDLSFLWDQENSEIDKCPCCHGDDWEKIARKTAIKQMQELLVATCQ